MQRTEEVESLLRAVEGRPEVKAALAYLRDEDEQTLATQIALTEVPAPPFGEALRAAALATELRATGLSDVIVDGAGNVVARRPGRTDGPPLVVSAHLDTVFPEGTDVTVTRKGSRLEAPGISDDGRGLACVVALARALERERIETEAPLLLVGTVGEEGIGDLRGVKALFGPSGAARGAAGFLSLDGAGMERIVTRGLGSRRFRIGIRGPGGHSWVDWGTPNPVHALTALGTRLATLELEDDPKTTLTMARVGGGKSINAIPQEAWVEIDTRCPDQAVLEELETRLRQALEDEERRNPELEYDVAVIGDRPGGATEPDALLVRAAVAATEHLGHQARTTVSSTDANVPMTLGIPAVTLGCGGDAGKAHTTEEWYDNENGPDGIVRALYTVLVTAGMADE